MNSKKIQHKLVFVLVLSFSFHNLFSQNVQDIKRQKDSIYQSNVKKSYLHNVYIPKDLNEAFLELKSLSSKESLQKYVSVPEEVVAKKLFYGVGRWMRFNWAFDEGSRFSKYLVDKGLRYPDDMVFFMLRSFHRHLLNKPLQTEELILELNKRREQAKENSIQGKEIISEETKQRKKNDE